MSLKNKTIVICNFPRFSGEIWLPTFWTQAKTYYELYGERTDEWNWYPCYADVYSSDYIDNIKTILRDAKPDVFAYSLYVWNASLSHTIAKWVKQTWPECIVICGGPHQYFKHNTNWFKEYEQLDASLPGDSYGELCITEILDNYNDSTKLVDWNKVSDMYFPSKVSRTLLRSRLTMNKSDRKQYHYDWAASSMQEKELDKFVEYQKAHFPNSLLLGILETTRGCPYGCTYCDWGGGTATNVLQKSIDTVKKDVDTMTRYELVYLYLADANFGIFGKRDVDLVTYIAEKNMQSAFPFKLGYGGYAKTENKLNFVKEIVEIDLATSLSHTASLKLSMQTLDEQILKNIDRVNINLEKQLGVFTKISNDNKIPLYVELIMGLPGMTLPKFYYEMNVLGSYRLSIQWFDWILLPEAPAYSKTYRDQNSLKTVIKHKGWATFEEDSSDREVVVGSNSYTSDDYMQMLISTSLYHLFVQGRYLPNVTKWIIDSYSIQFGDIIQNIYENFFKSHQLHNTAVTRWNEILSDENRLCSFNVSDKEVYVGWYFVALMFLNPDNIAEQLLVWIKETYDVPLEILLSDYNNSVNTTNFNTVTWKNFYRVDYRKPCGNYGNDITTITNLFLNYIDSDTFNAKRKFLGIF